ERIHPASGPKTTRYDRAKETLALTTHSRPVRPMYRFCTSCFHVNPNNPRNSSDAIATTRSVPSASIHRVARSITTGQVEDQVSASGMAMRTSSHAASVLQTATLSWAPMSAALVNGRVASKDATPQESCTSEVALLAVAAARPAMKGG